MKSTFKKLFIVFIAFLGISTILAINESYAQKPPADYIYVDYEKITKTEYDNSDVGNLASLNYSQGYKLDAATFNTYNSKNNVYYSQLELYIAIPKHQYIRPSHNHVNIMLDASDGINSGTQVNNFETDTSASGGSEYYKITFNNLHKGVSYTIKFDVRSNMREDCFFGSKARIIGR